MAIPAGFKGTPIHFRGQFPHAETRSFWTKRRHIAAFRARRDSVCVRDWLAG